MKVPKKIAELGCVFQMSGNIRGALGSPQPVCRRKEILLYTQRGRPAALAHTLAHALSVVRAFQPPVNHTGLW